MAPLDNLIWRLPCMLIMPILVYLEAKMFPEEQSLNKILNRLFTCGLFGSFFIPPIHNFFESNIGDVRFGEKQILSVIGYYAVSICVQTYMLYFSQEPKQESPSKSSTDIETSHK